MINDVHCEKCGSSPLTAGHPRVERLEHSRRNVIVKKYPFRHWSHIFLDKLYTENLACVYIYIKICTVVISINIRPKEMEGKNTKNFIWQMMFQVFAETHVSFPEQTFRPSGLTILDVEKSGMRSSGSPPHSRLRAILAG